MTTTLHDRRRQLGVVLLSLIGFLVVSTGPAAAAPSEPTMAPANGFADLRPVPAEVTFGGSVDTAGGWRYRDAGQNSGQAWVEFRDVGGSVLTRDDVTEAVTVAGDGTISGSTTLNTQAAPRDQAKTVRLAVRVTRDGDARTGHSADVLIDRDMPQIAFISVADPTTIQVTFSEPVTNAGGDSRRDWQVEGATVTGVRQPENGDRRIRYLDLLQSLPEGATPEVRYAPAIDNSRYVDAAGRPLGAANNPAPADDPVPPGLPEIVAIEGVSPQGGMVVRDTTTPSVRVGAVRAGETVELWRDGLVDTTRNLDRGAPDVRLAVRQVPDGASEVTFVASDYRDGLPPYVDHTLHVRVIDGSGNDAVSSARYRAEPGSTFAISRASGREGSPLTFTVTVTRPTADDPNTYGVTYATEDGSATAGTDYTATSGRLEFPPGTTTRTITVPTLEDDRDEGAETMRVRLSDATGGAALPDPPTATGTILEPAAEPEVSVFDTRADEGSDAHVVVQLTEPASEDVTVRWGTEDGTAEAGDDYTAASGSARIAAGITETTLTIALAQDDLDEPTETFSVVLSDPENATLGRTRATVRIIDGSVPAGRIHRLSGTTRIETSAAISRAVYDAAGTVVIATAEAYPDALAGAPLAARHDAPILLTGRTGLHPAVRDEVIRLGADTAIVLGGAKALSSQVDDDLRAAGVGSVRRVAGSNRFATAERIAMELGGDAVFVVEGAHADPQRGWPDAVAVSALAAYQERPILLVERDRLPDETRAALRRSSPRLATIAGGSAAVSGAVASAVDAEAGRVNRLAGPTRYETSRAIADASVAAGMDPATTWFATGADWPDSLSASPAVARTGGVLLLVASDRLEDSPPARDWLVAHRDVLRRIVLVGGTRAISSRVADQIGRETGFSQD